MTKVFLSIYYSILTFVLYYSGRVYFHAAPEQADFVLFARPFAPLLQSSLSFPALYIITISLSLACIIRPYIGLRFFVSLFFLILLSIKFSYGKINHSEHIWMISSVLVCFISYQKPLSSFRNLLVIRLMQTTLLSFYFISGLWKIRELGFSKWGEAALEHIAYAVAEGNGPGKYIQQLITVDRPWLTTAGFALVILFQISSIIPVFTMRYFKLWGIGAVFFHLSTGAVLGIWFKPTALAAILFLIFFQNLLDWERHATAKNLTPQTHSL